MESGFYSLSSVGWESSYASLDLLLLATEHIEEVVGAPLDVLLGLADGLEKRGGLISNEFSVVVDPFVLTQLLPLVGADGGEVVRDLVLEEDSARCWREVARILLLTRRYEPMDEVLNVEERRGYYVRIDALLARIKWLLDVVVHLPCILLEGVRERASDVLEQVERVYVEHLGGFVERAVEQRERYTRCQAIARRPRSLSQWIALENVVAVLQSIPDKRDLEEAVDCFVAF